MTFFDVDARSGRLLLGGRWIAADRPLDVIVPADGSTAGAVGLAGPEEVARATAAAAAQRDWAARPLDDRAKVLRTAAALLEQHADECADWLVVEAGSAREPRWTTAQGVIERYPF